jgi:hypothetical protein
MNSSRSRILTTTLAALTLTGALIACGSPSGEETSSSSEALQRRCNQAACTALGGRCVGPVFNSTCQPDCEVPPAGCTANVPYPTCGWGLLELTCTNLANGVYTFDLSHNPTLSPNMSWIPYTNYSVGNLSDGHEPFTFVEQPLVCPSGETPDGTGCEGIVEDNSLLPGGGSHAHFIKVCALPGQGQFTMQQGVCGGLEGAGPQACEVVPVTYGPDLDPGQPNCQYN